METSFWQTLPKPIIGLAPMDGVTDAAFRYIMDTYGKPHILITEFTPVEGITNGSVSLLHAFIHHKTNTPTIAQIYGTDVDAYYKAFFVVAEMGFDGIDINMGCPDKAISARGAGAGLILQPKLAQQIILTVKKAAQDWYEGRKMEDVGLPKSVIAYVKEFQKRFDWMPEKKLLPVSVKTRIGFEEIVTESWISNLLEVEPVNITVHGRTLRQMYTGFANWEEIGKAAALAHKTKTSLLGNGDVKTLEDAYEKIKTYNTDGVLIGRATFGNPWLFQNKDLTTEIRLKIALEHCSSFAKLTPEGHFLSLRKHLAWYTKGFDGAAEVRNQFMKVEKVEDVEKIISSIQYTDTASP